MSNLAGKRRSGGQGMIVIQKPGWRPPRPLISFEVVTGAERCRIFRQDHNSPNLPRPNPIGPLTEGFGECLKRIRFPCIIGMERREYWRRRICDREGPVVRLLEILPMVDIANRESSR